MYNVFEIDYNGRCYSVGKSENPTEAKKLANKAYINSNREYPVFVENGEKVVYHRQ